ncbi:MAG: TonB C-terminal domain-containing protein [Halobacteriovoraceae bacterium]|nr:TonB C-terminal domain-containing protein [Halobacteriovoraceae bacterium]
MMIDIRDKRKTRKLIGLTLLLTLLGHFIVFPVTLNNGIEKWAKKISENQPQEIILKLVNSTQTAEKQIVNTIKSENKKKDTKTKYLSDSDNFFYRETVAKQTDKFNIGAKGDPNSQNIEAQNQKSQKASKQKTESNKNVDLKNLSFNPLMHKVSKNEVTKSARKGTKHGLETQRGISSNNDFIEKLPLGEFSRLNTQEYQFYGFYFRIRQQLEDIWGVSLKEKAKMIFQQGRRLPASTNLITNLEITLDFKGKILKIKVMGTSGVKELDDAAIESFNEAGPFPNPPKELVKNGLATIKWGFVVKS